MQDLIALGDEGRMNFPSTVENNWTWRIRSECVNDWLAEILRRKTEVYKRIRAFCPRRNPGRRRTKRTPPNDRRRPFARPCNKPVTKRKKTFVFLTKSCILYEDDSGQARAFVCDPTFEACTVR